jgi:hypothetical protein
VSYVSCQYAPPDPELDANLKQGESARITCVDEQGRTWWLTEDSQVGDWLEYKANGGGVEPYVEPGAPGQA